MMCLQSFINFEPKVYDHEGIKYGAVSLKRKDSCFVYLRDRS